MLALLLTACGRDTPCSTCGTDASRPRDMGHDAPPNDVFFGDTNASDSGPCATAPTIADLDPILRNTNDGGCASLACHVSNNPGEAGVLAFDVPDIRSQLVGVTVSNFPSGGFRVIPGDVGHSFLWRKLTNDLAGGALGVPMPNTTPWMQLPADQLELVRCWIATGAH